MLIPAPIVQYSWIPIVLFLFNRYSPQRAIIISFVAGWMFLPYLEISIPFFPNFDRVNSISYAVLVGIFLFDSGRFSRLQPKWIDIPIIVWCVCHLPTSVLNGLGAYDGVVSSLSNTMSWGMPYLIGRLYFDSFAGLRRLAIGVLIGTIFYAPLCLIEARLMLNFHLFVYGFQIPTQSFMFSLRLGGYRPSVFMFSGLMLSVWMMAGALFAVVLWRFQILKKLWNFPMAFYAFYLVAVFVLIRSTGAYILFAAAIAIVFMARWLRMAPIFWAVLTATVLYMYLGASGNFPREPLVNWMSGVFEPDRVQSMDFRFENEEILSEKARQRPVWGWGGFGRNRVFNDYGEDTSVTDSLWIINFGVNGYVGLIASFGTLILPIASFAIRFPARLWGNPVVAPAATIAVFLLMYVYDCTANAMVNPVYTLMAGGIAGVVVNKNPLLDR